MAARRSGGGLTGAAAGLAQSGGLDAFQSAAGNIGRMMRDRSAKKEADAIMDQWVEEASAVDAPAAALQAKMDDWNTRGPEESRPSPDVQLATAANWLMASTRGVQMRMDSLTKLMAMHSQNPFVQAAVKDQILATTQRQQMNAGVANSLAQMVGARGTAQAQSRQAGAAETSAEAQMMRAETEQQAVARDEQRSIARQKMDFLTTAGEMVDSLSMDEDSIEQVATKLSEELGRPVSAGEAKTHLTGQLAKRLGEWSTTEGSSFPNIMTEVLGRKTDEAKAADAAKDTSPEATGARHIQAVRTGVIGAAETVADTYNKAGRYLGGALGLSPMTLDKLGNLIPGVGAVKGAGAVVGGAADAANAMQMDPAEASGPTENVMSRVGGALGAVGEAGLAAADSIKLERSARAPEEEAAGVVDGVLDEWRQKYNIDLPQYNPSKLRRGLEAAVERGIEWARGQTSEAATDPMEDVVFGGVNTGG